MKAARRAPAPAPARDYRAIWKSAARHLWSRDQDALKTIKRLLNRVAALEAEIRRLRGEG